jgi:hypothetical protein
MWRYSFTVIVAAGLIWAGIGSIGRGQVVVGIALMTIAAFRLGAILWSLRPRKPQPSIRLNLDDEDEPRS